MERLTSETPATKRAFPAVQPRGSLSRAVLNLLASDAPNPEPLLGELSELTSIALAASSDLVRDEDIQLCLFVLYSLHYGDVIERGDEWEWHPALVGARLEIESAFEAALRAQVACPPAPASVQEDVAAALFAMTAPDSGPSLSRYIAKQATDEQLREFLIQRSVYTLKEADPHSWAIPRLTGRAKAALVEIQADEYGQGRANNVHAAVYAATMRSVGLDDSYGAYLNDVPAITLASLNLMTMFGLNRRLRGAIVGHLAAFEMTSSIPSRLNSNGFRRLGYGEATTRYFDIHVEADAIHEQIAGRDLAGALAEDEPELLGDILFGAAACLAVDGWAGQHILEAWQDGRSSLRVRDAESEPAEVLL
ncbi:iron-containing redox enzyme family protein [Microterricola viridarii]|uniref:iron-containing redox enzyme family protein n=1 Tax=Microterricola viridarii TaxID=412690 RepID=UPI0009F2F083|nr:iron-containing redox enzyme family protein [Microterricola viridarii]